MKNILLSTLILTLAFALTPSTQAGDCKTRDKVDWHATITTAVNVRADCPTGDVVGVVPGGEVIRILEVDRFNEFYLIETSAGTGFVFNSFLKDITKSPLAVPEPGIFKDLSKDHHYYSYIVDVKEKGIVSGTPEGNIHADDPINRVELAKILVEATSDDESIIKAVLGSGIYSDIQANAWYLPYLKLARDKGIMTGDDISSSRPTTVRPGDFANGAEVAKMIAIAFELEIRPAGPDEEWYVPYMEALKMGEALPYEDPKHLVTRGEMMFMISRILSA